MWGRNQKVLRKLLEKFGILSTLCGNSLEGIKEKLKRMKTEIKLRNKDITTNSKCRKQQVVAQIEELDKCDDEDNLQDDMRVKQLELLSHLRTLEEK